MTRLDSEKFFGLPDLVCEVCLLFSKNT